MTRTVTRERRQPSGSLLRHWRVARNLSQLALAAEAGVSMRHLSFIETGRSQPSRDMIHRLAEVMNVPLRERNALLLSAGFAPGYPEAGIDLAAPHLEPVRMALDAMLAQQEPFPAVVLSRHWDVLKMNKAAERLFGFLLGAGKSDTPANVVRLMFDPRGLRPWVKNWEAAAHALVLRVHRESVGAVLDATTRKLLDEVLAQPGVPSHWAQPDLDQPLLPVIPVIFEKDGMTFSYFSAVTTLGTPQDVLLQELRVEAFYPMDGETRERAAAF